MMGEKGTTYPPPSHPHTNTPPDCLTQSRPSGTALARRKGRARRSMASGEMVGSRSVLRRAWSRPQRGLSGASRRRARGEEKKGQDGRTHELKGVRASTLHWYPEEAGGCCARLFQGPQDKDHFLTDRTKTRSKFLMLVNYSICSFAGFGHRIHGALRSRILRSRGPRALPLGRHTDDRTHPHGPRRRSP